MKKIQSSEYDAAIAANDFVVVDFSSPGCSPCKKVPPVIEELISACPDADIAAYEVDVTEAPDIAQKLFILGVPTVVIYKNGKETLRVNSVPKLEKLKKAIK